jgi:ppGpp synthetase/RelA/SpoT-type nucleotidyltranferase
MAKVPLKFSKTQIDAAGKVIIQPAPGKDNYGHALEVINNWRAVHNIPLLLFRVVLARRARKIYSKAIVVQRIKRLPAIKLKLTLIPSLKLSRMQDIGGCRAIVMNVAQVGKLVRLYQTRKSIHRLHQIDDYIFDKPKSSGYRAVHLIYHYCGDAYPEYKDLRIEIQIRSQFQHAWATAVETVDTITEQALKSSLGKDEWKRFFQLMGAALAVAEGTKPVPDTDPDYKELLREMKQYADQLDVINSLQAYGNAINLPPSILESGREYFLLHLDSNEKKIAVTSFKKDEFEKANEIYMDQERAVENQQGVQVVLVSTASIRKFASLKKAYPNYFMDTQLFVLLVRDRLQSLEKMER